MWGLIRSRIRRLAVVEPLAQEDPHLLLARQAEAGHEKALRELLELMAPHLLRVARQVLGAHHPEIHDVAQEAAWGLLRALPRFRADSSLVHFACRISLLTAMNVRRREASERRKLHSLGQLRDAQLACHSSVSPESSFSQAQCVNTIRSLLTRLSEEQAEVLGLHHVVGMTAAEISHAVEVPLETVRSRLKRGRQQLRQAVLNDPQFADERKEQRGHA